MAYCYFFSNSYACLTQEGLDNQSAGHGFLKEEKYVLPEDIWISNVGTVDDFLENLKQNYEKVPHLYLVSNVGIVDSFKFEYPKNPKRRNKRTYIAEPTVFGLREYLLKKGVPYGKVSFGSGKIGQYEHDVTIAVIDNSSKNIPTIYCGINWLGED